MKTILFLTVFFVLTGSIRPAKISLQLHQPIQYDNKFITMQNDIYSRMNAIYSAANLFHINPRILSVIIFTERYLNYSFLDNMMDFLLLDFGINASVGFAQVKFNTAKWIEQQINSKSGRTYFSKEILKKIPLSKTNSELKSRLENDSLNILYAAGDLAVIIKKWKSTKQDIDIDVPLLATLYSHGYMSPTHKVEINTFAKKAEEFYNSKNVLEKIK